MNELVREKLFSLLADASQQITNDEMRNAYGCFMEQLRIVSQSELNYSEVFRMLNTTRVELAFLKSLYRYGQGKKCPKICLSAKGFSSLQF